MQTKITQHSFILNSQKLPKGVWEFEGDLYKGTEYKEPFRKNYSRHHREIKNLSDFKACLRAGSSTDLGGYPLYFVMKDGSPLSFESAIKEFPLICSSMLLKDDDQWNVVGMEINYEDPELFCCHSSERIPSAYAED